MQPCFIMKKLGKGCFRSSGMHYRYFHYFWREKQSWLTTNLSYNQPSGTNWVRKSRAHCTRLSQKHAKGNCGLNENLFFCCNTVKQTFITLLFLYKRWVLYNCNYICFWNKCCIYTVTCSACLAWSYEGSMEWNSTVQNCDITSFITVRVIT
jgi:hypothetical protein